MPADRTAATPYGAERYDLTGADGQPVAMLTAIHADDAARLGAALARIEPWRGYGASASGIASFLAKPEAGAVRFAIRSGGDLAGTVIIREPWLLGPYLNLLAFLPEHQGRGLGRAVLAWMQREAPAGTRNLWLCVTASNHRARAFYQRHGFETAATLDHLVADGMDEILMRKRLR